MSIPYESLKIWQLLCIADAYEKIDAFGKQSIPDWDIDDFEKHVLYGTGLSYELTENLIEQFKKVCSSLSKKKPYLSYTEDGIHYGFELFVDDIMIDDIYGEPQFYTRLSRTLSNYRLPIDEQVIKDKIDDVSKQFLPVGKAKEALISSDSLWYTKCLDDMTFRTVRNEILRRNRVIEARNRLGSFPPPVFLEEAVRVIKSHCNQFSGSKYFVKENLTFDDILRALEYTSTRNQIDAAFLVWGVYTGKPISYAEAGRQLGKTGNAVINSMHKILSHIAWQAFIYDSNSPKPDEEREHNA